MDISQAQQGQHFMSSLFKSKKWKKIFIISLMVGNNIISQTSAMMSHNDPSLVPNVKMKSAQGSDLEIFTGLFYIIGVQESLSEGYVTYTGQESKNGHYMQIAVKELEKYRAGGVWRDCALWSFCSTEVPAYYSVSVKSLPMGYMTYTDQESVGGRYMQIALKEVEKYRAGQIWRNCALWTLKPSETAYYYTLGVKSLPTGFMTYTAQESANGHYMQVALNGVERYKTGGVWRKDASWKFWPSNYKIVSSIEDFQYTSPLERINQHKIDMDMINAMVFRNDGNVTLQQTISKTRTTENTYTWRFQENKALRLANILTITAKASASFLGLISANAKATNVFEWESKKNTHERFEKIVKDRKTHQIQQTITVPPHTRVKAQSIIKWVNNATIPFTATLKMQGLADRLKYDGSVVPSAPIKAEVLRHFLSIDNYQGKFIRETENAVYVQIHGNLIVNAGFDTLFKTEKLH